MPLENCGYGLHNHDKWSEFALIIEIANCELDQCQWTTLTHSITFTWFIVLVFFVSTWFPRPSYWIIPTCPGTRPRAAASTTLGAATSWRNGAVTLTPAILENLENAFGGNRKKSGEIWQFMNFRVVVEFTGPCFELLGKIPLRPLILLYASRVDTMVYKNAKTTCGRKKQHLSKTWAGWTSPLFWAKQNRKKFTNLK